MWIRVESFPLSSTNSDNPSTVLNLFAGRIEDQGILLTLGRKTGDITFPDDKSVSRQHCVIKVCQITGTNGDRQLVVENEGKAGTFIAEPQVTPIPTKTTSPGQDVDSDATDDEGVVSQRVASQVQVSTLGSGTVMEDFAISKTIQDLWKEPLSKLQMVKIDVGQSRILDFQPHRRSILMQFGLNGSTIQLTWVPFHVTFSRVPKQLQKDLTAKLPLIGAIEDPQIMSTTTHLVTAGTVTVTAKPLTACCRGIPIVTPDYLQALLDYNTATDPPPLADNYKATFESNMSLLERQPANPKLMQRYLVLTLESGEMDPLFQFSGATVVPLHELANDQERLNKAMELVDTSNQVTLILTSRKRVFSKISALDGVHAIKPEAWAKAIVTQSGQIKDVSGNLIPIDNVVNEEKVEAKVLPQKKQGEESDTDEETPALSRPKSLQTQEESGAHRQRLARKRAKNNDSPPASPIEVLPMPELEAPPVKRRRRGEQAKITLNEDPPAKNVSAAPQEEEPSSQEFTLLRRRATNHPSQGVETDQSQSASTDPAKVANTENAQELPKPQRPQVLAPRHKVSTKQQSITRNQANVNEWLVVAPKDNATRKALWEKASMANAEKPDGAHFKPPALSQPCAVITAPSAPVNTIQSTSNQLALRGRRTNGPDFRRFRKNTVPRLVDESELILVQAVHAKESQQQLRLQENQRELEKQQRLADELFREIGGGTTRRRRR